MADKEVQPDMFDDNYDIDAYELKEQQKGKDHDK